MSDITMNFDTAAASRESPGAPRVPKRKVLYPNYSHVAGKLSKRVIFTTNPWILLTRAYRTQITNIPLISTLQHPPENLRVLPVSQNAKYHALTVRT